MFDFKKLVSKYLREAADRFDADSSELSEAEAIDILRIVAHEVMSKAQACQYLNLSPQRFDQLIREKKIPKGRKVVGYKELRWYRDELDMCKYRKNR